MTHLGQKWLGGEAVCPGGWCGRVGESAGAAFLWCGGGESPGTGSRASRAKGAGGLASGEELGEGVSRSRDAGMGFVVCPAAKQGRRPILASGRARNRVRPHGGLAAGRFALRPAGRRPPNARRGVGAAQQRWRSVVGQARLSRAIPEVSAEPASRAEAGEAAVATWAAEGKRRRRVVPVICPSAIGASHLAGSRARDSSPALARSLRARWPRLARAVPGRQRFWRLPLARRAFPLWNRRYDIDFPASPLGGQPSRDDTLSFLFPPLSPPSCWRLTSTRQSHGAHTARYR